MAVNELKFTFAPEGDFFVIKESWAHTGVVGSGDLEILANHCADTNEMIFQLRTKVVGYDEVWRAVLQRFTKKHRLGGMLFEINDNAATPAVVIKRLEQLLSAGGGLVQGVAK